MLNICLVIYMYMYFMQIQAHNKTCESVKTLVWKKPFGFLTVMHCIDQHVYSVASLQNAQYVSNLMEVHVLPYPACYSAGTVLM